MDSTTTVISPAKSMDKNKWKRVGLIFLISIAAFAVTEAVKYVIYFPVDFQAPITSGLTVLGYFLKVYISSHAAIVTDPTVTTSN